MPWGSIQGGLLFPLEPRRPFLHPGRQGLEKILAAEGLVQSQILLIQGGGNLRDQGLMESLLGQAQGQGGPLGRDQLPGFFPDEGQQIGLRERPR